jgi:endonuclease/exonuclease/phosphatase family metal-dependent hydrolase
VEHTTHPDLPLVEGTAEHPVLRHWQANVGSPLVLNLAPPAPEGVRGLDVLSWNLGIGTARLGELLARLRAGEWGGAGTDPARPLVVLAQEAYRADDTVPPVRMGRHHGGLKVWFGQTQIAQVAEQEGLSLRYAPSMRNGSERSDRGNAILSTAALGGAHAFTLPFVKQRRVAVAAELVGLPGLALVSAHVDTWGRTPGAQGPFWRFGGGRAAQTSELARRILATDAPGGVVLGADLNSPLGRRDPAVRALERHGFVQATPQGMWGPTFAGRFGFLLDHVLFFPRGGRIRRVTAVRLDEPGREKGRVFGSDHHPLLARVELAGE